LPPKALERLEAELGVELERPASVEHGDFATNAALQLAPKRKRSPREIAEELAEQATAHELVERAEVAGPGFVNLWLAPAWYVEALGEVLEGGERYGGGFVDPVERVQVEMVSATPTGPITVAAARNGAYGDSVARVLAHAKGLVASSDSDVDNLYITLSARTVRPDLLIVARASEADVAEKLRRAGADRIVQPYSAAGKEMAALVLRPQVAAFLEVVSATGGADLQYEEIVVTEASGQVGKTIRELRIRHETGAVIVALRREDGTFDATPDPDAVLESADVIIAAGSADELRRLEEQRRRRVLGRHGLQRGAQRGFDGGLGIDEGIARQGPGL